MPEEGVDGVSDIRGLCSGEGRRQEELYLGFDAGYLYRFVLTEIAAVIISKGYN